MSDRETMNQSVFGVGLVGCGFMGRMHVQVMRALEGVNLRFVCDKRPEKAAEVGAPIADFDAILANPEVDVVDVCLPTYLHSEFTIRALEAGKHVVCEKPMAISLEEADRMIAASKATGKRLMVAHCIRFWPEYEVLTRLTREGTFGKLLSLNLTRYGAFPAWSSDNWLADESKSGGGALDMHIHDTDYALYLLGEPTSSRSLGTVDARGVSQIFTTMTFGETIVQLEGGWNLPASAPFKMAFRAIFERGAAIMDAGPLTIYEEGKDAAVPEMSVMRAEGAGGNVSDLGGYYYELSYFYDRLRSGEPFERITPESSRSSLATVLDEIQQAKGARA